ncbi:MAG: 3-deoxy-7-phosphoheptulonate synthase, partial [bacterium]|nr:3-deoxy-7-phosphoheptulonate synthase [bacterium]
MKTKHMLHLLHNQNIRTTRQMPTPAKLKEEFCMTNEMCRRVLEGRGAVRNIITSHDKRFLIAAGPCSMHDHNEYLEYTRRSCQLAEKVSDVILLIQRANPLKPRSESNGWRGMAADHSMKGERDLIASCRKVRHIMWEAVQMGALLATEIMDPNHYQYVDDLPVFAWIGADNCTNTRLREVASGLSCSVGCKHPKQLHSVISAVRALGFVSVSNTFLAQNDHGRFTEFTTEGNIGCIIHRGFEVSPGVHQPNYDRESLRVSREDLQKAGLNQHKLIDLSHSNASKKHEQQVKVLNTVLELRDEG